MANIKADKAKARLKTREGNDKDLCSQSMLQISLKYKQVSSIFLFHPH